MAYIRGMKLLQRFFAFALVALTLTSCFDVKEEIIFNADGSGAYEQTIDLSQVIKTFTEDSTYAETTRKSNEKISIWLKKIPGIHNVNVNEKSVGITRIGFEFNSISALNNALKNSGTYPTYVWSKNAIIYNGGIAQFGDSTEPVGSSDESSLFSTCKYTYSITLPAKKVKKCSNKGVTITKNNITLATTLDKLIENNKFNAMEIKFK